MTKRVLAIAGLALCMLIGTAQEPRKADPPKNPEAKPKRLSKETLAGLQFLVQSQRKNGGWGSADAFPVTLPVVPGAPVVKPKGPVDDGVKTDVGNTSMAALALLRAGYSPKQGYASTNITKAVNYVLSHVEASDRESLLVTDVKGTLLHRKIGENADTFLAALLLAEAKGKMPDQKTEKRINDALVKIVDKMQKNQKEDGTWGAMQAWAPVLSQGLASRALNRARQVGIPVSEEALARTAAHGQDSIERLMANRDAKDPRAGLVGAAGVQLYGVATHIGALQDALQTRRVAHADAEYVLAKESSSEEEKKRAKEELGKLKKAEEALDRALLIASKQITDQQFIRGFGSDGGEEYLSFIFIGETLRARNHVTLREWDRSVTDRLMKAQNRTGDWSGKHCITGKTFCTAAAVMVLMADRAPTSMLKR